MQFIPLMPVLVFIAELRFYQGLFAKLPLTNFKIIKISQELY